MATLALPAGFSPANLLRSKGVVLGAVGLLLASALAAVVMLLPSGSPGAKVSLDFAHAPKGWTESLHPPQGVITATEVMIRLTEAAAAPLAAAGHSASAPAQPLPVSGPLPAAPIAGVFTQGPGGLLPIISLDGRTPFDVYKRPFVSNGRPKVALVVSGLGLNARATQTAIETLPAEVTLSFVAYSEGLQGWIDQARAHGHEVLLETPMEPVDYPNNDPGPYTLMADAQGAETVRKLEWVLSRATGYFGLTNYLGDRFLASAPAYTAFATALKGRGLAFIDDGHAAQQVGGGVQRASAERMIDAKLTQAAIDQQLGALESSALQHGQALGAGFAYPVTLAKVARWTQGLEARGLQLAPASALTKH